MTSNRSLGEAKQRLGAGDMRGAERAFRDAIEQDDGCFEAHLGLGRVLIEMNRAPAALPHLRTAAAGCPDDLQAGFLIARCEGLCGNHHDSARLFEMLRVRAGDLPDIHAGLVDALERAGRVDDAKLAATEAVEKFPRNVDIAVLAARVDRRQGRLGDAADRLRAIDDGAGRPADQAQRYNELGQVLDRMDDVPAAFAAFERANKWFREVYDRRRIPEGTLQRQIADMAAFVEDATPTDLEPVGADDAEWGHLDGPPHFIVGFLRSGTTLLHQMLDAREDVCVVDERPMALRARAVIAGRDGGYPSALGTLDPQTAGAARTAYADSMASELSEIGRPAPTGSTLVDKFPMNLVRAPMLHRLGGGSRFVVAVRDPLDVCLSCYMQAFQPSAVTRPFLDLEETARVYVSAMSMWRAFADKAGPPAREVLYEAVVEDPETESRAISDFLGLPWDTAMLSFDEHARRKGAVANPSYHQVTQPIYRDALARWRRYEVEIKDILTILEPIRAQLGYS